MTTSTQMVPAMFRDPDPLLALHLYPMIVYPSYAVLPRDLGTYHTTLIIHPMHCY